MNTIAYGMCLRWDEENWNVILEVVMRSSHRDALLQNITPGAVAELYNILGEPKYIDTTYNSGNTLWVYPLSGTGLFDLREPVKIAVKNYSEHLLRDGTFRIKIEGVKLE